MALNGLSGHLSIDGDGAERRSVAQSVLEKQFIELVRTDLADPADSFTDGFASMKGLLQKSEESLSSDRQHLKKVNKTLKGMNQCIGELCKEQTSFAEHLEIISAFHENEPLANALRQLSDLQRALYQLQDDYLFRQTKVAAQQIEGLVKHEDSSGELSRSYEKNMARWKSYWSAKKEKLLRKDDDAELDEFEREKFGLQLETCDYLLKMKESRFKKEVDFLKEMVDLYQAELVYFERGVEAMNRFKESMTEVSNQIKEWTAAHKDEREDLVRLQEDLRKRCPEKADRRKLHAGSNVHGQLEGEGASTDTSKAGWLYKQGKQLKTWQKRWATVNEGKFELRNGPDASTYNQRVDLLTCTVKEVPMDSRKYCFRLVTMEKTWTFAVDTVADMNAWISVIRNNINELLTHTFDTDATSITSTSRQSIEDFKRYRQEVSHMRGNGVCADCFAPEPEWVSLNLGVLICIACSGIHREMGVHFSKVRSLALDKLSVPEVLMVKAIGNTLSNSIYLANPTMAPITEKSDMKTRKDYIMAKYKQKRFVVAKTPADPTHRAQQLVEAVQAGDMSVLVQLHAEGANMQAPLPDMEENGVTPLHYAVLCGSHLAVDYMLVTNAANVNAVTDDTKSTPLHYAARLLQAECIQTLLRYGADTTLVDRDGLTPEMVARSILNQSEEVHHPAVTLDPPNRSGETSGQSSAAVSSVDLVPGKLAGPGNSRESLAAECVALLACPPVAPSKVCSCPVDSSVLCTCSIHSCGGDCRQAAPLRRMYKTGSLDSVESDTGSHSPEERRKKDGLVHRARSLSMGVLDKDKDKDKDHDKKHKPSKAFQEARKRLLRPRSRTNAPEKDGRIRRIDSLGSLPDSPHHPPAPQPHSHSANASPNVAHVSFGSVGQSPPHDVQVHSRLRTEVSVDDRQRRRPMSDCELDYFQSENDDTPGQVRLAEPQRVVALYGCEGQDEQELSFRKGDVIVVVEKCDDGWWLGYVDGRPDVQGLLPHNYVQPV